MPVSWGRGLRRVYYVAWGAWVIFGVVFSIWACLDEWAYLDRPSVIRWCAIMIGILGLGPWGLLKIIEWTVSGFRADKSN